MPDVRIKFQGETVVVREFVMDDFDAIFADQHRQEQEQAAWHALPAADRATSPMPVCWFNRLFDGKMVTRKMVELATGLDVAVLQQARPSELHALVDGVREANPDFFAMIDPTGLRPGSISEKAAGNQISQG